MTDAYENAKQIALGLALDPPVEAGADLWNVGLAGGAAAEMPFQFFEKGFEPPEELLAQKAVLMLYDDEYAADRATAEDALKRLTALLKKGDAERLRAFLNECPPAGWLSLVFVDAEALQSALLPAIERADAACKGTLEQALETELGRLQAYRELLESLKSCCRAL